MLRRQLSSQYIHLKQHLQYLPQNQQYLPHVTSLTEPASHLATRPAVPSLTEPPSVHSVHALSPSSVLLCLSPQSIITTCSLSSNQPSEYMPSLQSTGNQPGLVSSPIHQRVVSHSLLNVALYQTACHEGRCSKDQRDTWKNSWGYTI